MKKELVDLQPKLEQAKIDNTKIMKVRNSNIYHTVSVFKANVHFFVHFVLPNVSFTVFLLFLLWFFRYFDFILIKVCLYMLVTVQCFSTVKCFSFAGDRG